MSTVQTRRSFLTTLASAGAAWAANAGLLHTPGSLAAEGAPETTTIRLAKNSGICIAPQYVAEELLRAEGFTDVRYIATEPGIAQTEAIGRGDLDFSLNFAAPLIIPLDSGTPITVIAGVHVGCFELFGNEGVRSVGDLKGKKVGVQGLGSGPHVFLAAIAAHVGLDPVKDIQWVVNADPSVKPMEMFADGKIDAFLGFPPEPQELRARPVRRARFDLRHDRVCWARPEERPDLG